MIFQAHIYLNSREAAINLNILFGNDSVIKGSPPPSFPELDNSRGKTYVLKCGRISIVVAPYLVLGVPPSFPRDNVTKDIYFFCGFPDQ